MDEARVPLWFYTSDLHGQGSLYEQLVALAAARCPEVVLIGGDLCQHATGSEGLALQRVFLQGTLVEFARRLREGCPGTELLLMMGNDDWAVNMDCLEAHDGTLWRLLHERVVDVRGQRVAGLSWVPITPFAIKDWERWDDGAPEAPLRLEGWSSWSGTLEAHHFDPERRSPTIAAALESVTTLTDPGDAILVSHSPPRDTCCDTLQSGSHVGSRAIRTFVEAHQPPLVLSGHIHEAPRVSGSHRDRVGRTIVVNPGQFGTSRLCGVWFDPTRVEGTLRHTVFE